YQQGEEALTIGIKETAGGNFEALDTTSTTTTTVVDNSDATTLTLGDITVAEGSGTATIGATLSQPTDREFTVTLSNGATITFAANSAVGTSTAFAVQNDDVYQDGESYTVSVTDSGAHNFEQLDSSDTATVTVTDTVDTTTLTLGDITAAEGSGTATIGATLSQPTDREFTVTLSNGATITFAANSATGTSTTFAVQGDDIYQDGESYTVSVVNAGEHNFEQLDVSDTASVTVTDTVDTTAITLSSDNQVIEGGAFTVTATVGAPVTGSPLVITLSNDQTITIPVGESTGTVQIASRADDSYQQGEEALTIGIKETVGGNYEALDTSSTTTTTVVDNSDTTTLTLGDITVAEGSGTATIGATLSQPTDREFTVTLSNGATITFAANSATATSTAFAVQGDDVYQDGESYTVSVTDSGAHNFEQLDSSDTATVTVTDTVDTTTLTLGDITVAEGSGTATIGATLSQPTDREFTVTLSNGATITFAANSTVGTSTAFAVQNDDVYQDGESYTVSVVNAGEHNFEQLDSSDTATVTVTDTVDTTAITLSSDNQVIEGGAFTVIATVGSPVTGSPLIITLSNDQTITILVGESTGTVQIASRADDSYQQGEEALTIGIKETAGGNFEALDTSSTTTTTVVDNSDATTLTLGDVTVAEGSGTATIGATLSQPTDREFTVTLSNGATITFAANSAVGTSTAFTVQSDDVYQDGESYTVSVVNAGEHNFEQLDVSDTATVTITDTVDTTTLTLGDVTVAEGSGTATIGATLSQPTDREFTVTLSNGATIAFAANSATATSTAFAVQGDDVYQDGESYTVSVTDSGAHNFEQLDSSDTATVTVTDTVDTTAITLSSDNQVTEGGAFTVTATVGAPVTGSPLVITLSNDQTITIPVGESTGSIQIETRGDDSYQQGEEALTIGIKETVGGNFEALDTTSTTTTTVVDNSDTTTLTLGDITVAEGSGTATIGATLSQPTDREFTVTLSNGATITFAANSAVGTSTAFTVQSDDVYQDGESYTVSVVNAGEHNFEQLDVSDTATVTVTDTVDTTAITLSSDNQITEGNVFTVTATVGAPVTDSPLVITLSNDQTITIPVGESSGSVQIASRADDRYRQGDESITVGNKETSGGNYEALDTTSTTTTTVVDDNDATKITLEGPDIVTEGDDITITARVELPPQGTDLTITLTNGQTITIPVGQTEGSTTYPARSDDVLVQGDISQSVGIEGSSGGNYENLVHGDPTITTVLDNDVPVLTVSDAGEVNEGNAATFDMTLSKPVDNATTLTFTLGGGNITSADIGTPTVTINGQGVPVSQNADGSYSLTVPAGTTGGIVVSVPTVEDGVFEGRENFTLSAALSGQTAGGTELPVGIGDSGAAIIIDNELLPAIDAVSFNPDGDQVIEGGVLLYQVTLNHASATETTFSFTLRNTGSTADETDIQRGDIRFSHGVTYDAASGTISVPAGVTEFAVSVPTVDDNIAEADETVIVTVGDKSATGTIVDNDDAPTVDTVTFTPAGDTVVEGQDLTYTVKLSNPSSSATTFDFVLRN
ncbi:hypothetical protein B4923_20565, partial [Brenneria roseae subsp. americana]